MRDGSGRLVLLFSGLGHFFFHYLAAMYFTIVLSLANDWNQPFHDLIALVREATGSFELLIYGLGVSAAVTSIIVMLLPREVPFVWDQT